jgi:methylenetetrahydrofolate dehydrogenase (NADP+)/methenyltetrahydrofolate cyclohydrolase
METTILDGKKVASKIEADLKKRVQQLDRAPTLAVVLVGNHPASKIYVRRKEEACKRVGIESLLLHLDEGLSSNDLKKVIHDLNKDKNVDGILVQLPLPQHISPLDAASWIDPNKDVDGLNPINMGKLLMGQLDGFIPCTPLGIKKMLDEYNIDVTGRHVVILGRSNIVGKPMGALLTQINPGYDATVTILHRNSPDLKQILLSGDILIIAAGQPHLIQPDMVKPRAVIVDVGINKLEDVSLDKTKIVGDVDFDKVWKKCSYISPVPGGVGPMTIAMLLENTLKAHTKSHH